MSFAAKFEASWHYALGDLGVFWRLAAMRISVARFAWRGALFGRNDA